MENHAVSSAGDDSTDPLAPAAAQAWAESPKEQPRDRRREKPQLSCNFCRRRKIRCDRRLPCTVCVGKGLALSCSYATRPQQSEPATVTVSERLQQLEALVLSLMSQQQQQQRQQLGADPRSALSGTHLSLPNDQTYDASSESPAPSEHGRMREHSRGGNYVGSVHWAAVLDSISELMDRCEEEEEQRDRAREPAPDDHTLQHGPAPRLLYEPVKDSKADILASLPARPVVDRVVARYFNAQGLVPAILHSGQFLREYESFWRDPAAASFVWIGLLFSVICLATQLQEPGEELGEWGSLEPVSKLHERIVQCLVLGQYTRGGPYVLETLINYCGSELCRCADVDPGPWLPVGILVQLALSRGYHRDPRAFPNISPFTGEMRRRVWAAIVQMDLRFSSQMGLPHLLKSTQYNTAEPCNLADSDFDEATVQLPPPRPETELTPVLYSLARSRVDKIGSLIGDLVASTRDPPYAEIMELDRKLLETESTLPPIFWWQPLSQSLAVPPQVLVFRAWLQLAVLRLVVWLHRKYLAPSYSQATHGYSRDACVRAAMKILELQLLFEEEARPGGQLRQRRWMQSSLLQSTFLLGMSILCYYTQLAKTAVPHAPPDPETQSRILDLLRDTYPLWLRSSVVSRDAREAAERLRRLPDLQGQLLVEVTPLAQGTATASLAAPLETPISGFHPAWDPDQGTSQLRNGVRRPLKHAHYWSNFVRGISVQQTADTIQNT